MNKTFLCCLLLAASIHSSAQVAFGFTGGANFTNTSGAGSGGRVGAYLGAVAEVRIGNAGSFMPQLAFVMKGENASSGKGAYNYVELPLNFFYNIPSSVGRFSVGGGPVVSYMVAGSWTGLGAPKETINFSYDRVNQLDYGLNVQAGLKVKGGVFFTIHYTLGLANVWQADNLTPNKNRAIGAGIGIML